MGGLLDALGMGGQRSDGGLGLLDALQAQYAPGAYGAEHQRMMERAVQAAMMQRPGMTPEMAHAFGASPQYMQQFGQAQMPQLPQVHWSPQPEGGESPFISSVNGQNASVSQMGINPVGTTPNPVQATTPSPMPGPTQGAPQAAAPQKPITNTAGLGNLAENAKAMRDAGKNEDEIIALLPGNVGPYIKDVLAGNQDIDKLPPRAPDTAFLKKIISAIRPGWDARLAKAQQGYIDRYSNPDQQKLGGQIKMIGATSGHLADTGDALINMHNWGQGGGGITDVLPEGAIPDREGKGGALGAQTINELRNRWQPGQANEVDTIGGVAAKELDKFVSGGNPTVSGTEEYLRKINHNASPAGQAGTLRGLKKVMEDQIIGMERERDQTFAGSPERAKNFPIRTPEYEANMKRMDAQIAKLDPAGPEAKALKQGGASTPPPSTKEQAGVKSYKDYFK